MLSEPVELPGNSPLLCPHGMQVYMGSREGIIHYAHPDGASCELLNRFDTTTDQLLLEMTQVQSDPFVFYAGFVASKAVRFSWYRYLSALDAPQLARALKQTQFLKTLPLGTGSIAVEIQSVFGQMFWENLKEVAPDVAASFVMSLGHTGQELLPMVSLKDDQTTNMWYDIDKAVNGLRKRGVYTRR